MPIPLHDVFRASETLDPDDRMTLAMMLASTLGDAAATDEDAAWGTELARRIDAIESGREQLPSIEELEAMIDKTAAGRRRAALLTGLDRIAFRPAVMGGSAYIRGVSWTVGRVLVAMATALDASPLPAEHPELTLDDIRQALRFAARVLEE
jgi:uncharacterized protein (DUF433 family)